MEALKGIGALLGVLVRSRASLVAENLALRQQLAVLERSVKRPRLRRTDRIFWAWLSRLWSGWESVLVIVKPETVVRWHRQGFRLYWRWKSRNGNGRPKVDLEIRELIRRMSRENPTWGAPRIRSELRLLGHDVAKSTVAKYMTKHRRPPSQGWRTFLTNHASEIAAIDFFVVPTVTFRLLFGFVILRHQRREVVHFNVTEHPSAAWTAQQVIEAFPFDEAPKYLLRDRDGIYGAEFVARVHGMGVEEVLTAPHAPWQNPYVERLIGSIRRECLNHVIVLNEAHLRRLLREYLRYYHADRPHTSLDSNPPRERQVEPRSIGGVVGLPRVGGLHHRYTRAA
jgi:transposase InsO family protein